MRALHGEPDGFRIDTGEYPVLFQVDTKERMVKIVRVRHRKDAYRNL